MDIQSFSEDQLPEQYPMVSNMPESSKKFSNTLQQMKPVQILDLEKQFSMNMYPAITDMESVSEVDQLMKNLEREGFAALISRCLKSKMQGFHVGCMKSVVSHQASNNIDTPKLLAALDCLQKNGEENVTLYRLYQLANERSLALF